MTEGQGVTFGISRSHGGSTVEDAARAFARALTSKVGFDVRVAIEGDYDQLLASAVAGRVGMAWLPPLLYAQAAVQGLTLAVVPERGGHLTYRSAILVRKDAPFESPEQLDGKRAAWVDPKSASGYVFPRIELTTCGVSFGEEMFAGSVNLAARAVIQGKADFCACFVTRADTPEEVTADLAGTLGELARELRPVRVTEPIPPDGLVFGKGLSDALAKRMTSGLLGLHDSEAGRQALKSFFRADRLVASNEASFRMLQNWTRAGSAATPLESQRLPR